MGQVVQMDVVHHKDGDPWNRSWDNLESLCNDCHEYEEDRMKKAKIGADGIPTNPSHPWS
jgi:nitrate/TMAO reductase-like tetraheme cytochrome c subunit